MLNIDNIQVLSGFFGLSDYDFYICGPPIMLELQIKNLLTLGIPSKKIHYERFNI